MKVQLENIKYYICIFNKLNNVMKNSINIYKILINILIFFIQLLFYIKIFLNIFIILDILFVLIFYHIF